MDATVLAAIVEQRLEAGILAAVGGLDAAHEDGVIPARIGVDGGALELGQGIFEDGHWRETDVKALAVRPMGRPSLSTVVMIVTPEQK